MYSYECDVSRIFKVSACKFFLSVFGIFSAIDSVIFQNSTHTLRNAYKKFQSKNIWNSYSYIYIHGDDYIHNKIFRWFNVAQFSVLVMTFQQQTMLFTFRILVCYKIIIFIINNIICYHSTISTCQIQSAQPNTVR